MDRRVVGTALCLGVVALVLVAGLSVAKPRAGPSAGAGATWTFAVYVDGNNNLARYWAQYSLPWLEAVPANAQVNLVALVALANSTNTYVERISGRTVTVLETYGVMDMGSPATLSWWIDRSTTLFPSTYYALDIWDHGYGWKYVSVDDTSGNDLSMPELQSAIAASGKTVSILAFDACNMGNAEVAYQMSKTSLVSYLVGSEETVPGNGYPYDKMLTPLAANPAMTPHDLAATMVDGWGAYYGGLTWANTVNLAAYDLTALRNGIGTFTMWSSEMTRMLPSYRAYYASAIKASYYAWGTHYFPDLKDYAAHLLGSNKVADPALRAATSNVQAWVTSLVVKVWNANKMTMCGGITFYFGTGSEWTSSSASYLATAFAADTGWGGFLTAYNG